MRVRYCIVSMLRLDKSATTETLFRGSWEAFLGPVWHFRKRFLSGIIHPRNIGAPRILSGLGSRAKFVWQTIAMDCDEP